MGDQQKVSVSIDIAAPPEKVYAMVSDLPRMGEWSPENTGGKWIGGAKAALPGAKFMGSNKNGNRKWTVPVRITDATAPRRLEFVVGVGPIKGATWRYEIAATATGCNVTETWEDTRVGLLKNATGSASWSPACPTRSALRPHVDRDHVGQAQAGRRGLQALISLRPTNRDQ